MSYFNTLYADKKCIRNVCSIRSFNHELFTYTQNKIALTNFYDKMKMTDGINNEPYGYMEQ